MFFIIKHYNTSFSTENKIQKFIVVRIVETNEFFLRITLSELLQHYTYYEDYNSHFFQPVENKAKLF